MSIFYNFSCKQVFTFGKNKLTAMEVNYIIPAEKGKQCKDCKNFEPEKSSDSGKCMGYSVQTVAGCNLFEAKIITN